MSVTINRKRGDNYPIGATIKINGEAVDLTGSEMKFSFKNSEGLVTTVIGVIDVDAVGVVNFTPTVEQMAISGQYQFDIQREIDTVVSTHLSGTMLLSDDVTP